MTAIPTSKTMYSSKNRIQYRKRCYIFQMFFRGNGHLCYLSSLLSSASIGGNSCKICCQSGIPCTREVIFPFSLMPKKEGENSHLLLIGAIKMNLVHLKRGSITNSFMDYKSALESIDQHFILELFPPWVLEAILNSSFLFPFHIKYVILLVSRIYKKRSITTNKMFINW